MFIVANEVGAALSFSLSGTQVFTGPYVTVTRSDAASDVMSAAADGTIDISSGYYTANGAGIIVAPSVASTGNTPGQTSMGMLGYPHATVLIGNSDLGYFPLFLSDYAQGLGRNPPRLTYRLTAP